MYCTEHHRRYETSCARCDQVKVHLAWVADKKLENRADSYQVAGDHYKNMPRQPWAVMAETLTHEEFVGFLKGSIIKYEMRDGKKPGAVDDAQKAEHYRAKLKEVQG